MPQPLSLDDFDFDLPAERIAQRPAEPRDAARLLQVGAERLTDLRIPDLVGLLRAGDRMVVNDTRVIPARLHARRGEARIEIMLNRAEGEGRWHALIRNARRLHAGDTLVIEGGPALDCTVVERQEGGAALLRFGPGLEAALEHAGEVPLPPYITREHGPTARDRADYQAIFAARPGAVAAPTASLHFTPALLVALEARGVTRSTVTLHVGAGTFLPIRDADARAHRMHAEWGEVTEHAAAEINATRQAGGRVIAIGTTALRLLESAATPTGIAPFRGLTDIYILPGHRFASADLLLTNFHLPRSTLLLLVSAFAGSERIRAAYAHAIAGGYRFYSYGDACLLERAP
ncbi:tRNA preQ1(34) S-adenosylmethionine ribosyltransferase-isomerase QueA [Plastoroseomonas arctica]|uniref:tRNA preQ1(34) S-adenosylmethionine ribosyltransferase-isomerase QueA n=1 Tax=Plastoroseomonas arctica TaxID=1509237 RepID=UPI003461A946